MHIAFLQGDRMTRHTWIALIRRRGDEENRSKIKKKEKIFVPRSRNNASRGETLRERLFYESRLGESSRGLREGLRLGEERLENT